MTNLPSDNKMAAKRSQANKPQAFRFDQKVHSNAAGWGKKAAERLSNKEQFKNDPLLKTLEGKIAMNYGDYQPWQRTTNPRHMEKEAPAKAPALSKIARGRPASSRMSNSARSLKGVRREDTLLSMAGGARPYSAATVHSTRTACSSVCAHPWIVKKPPPVDDADLRRRQNAISIMKMQIKARKKSIAEYARRKEELLQENIALQEAIQGSEKNIHGDVKGLLQKYECFRGSLAVLNMRYEKDLNAAKRRLADTKCAIATEEKELQHRLRRMDNRLQERAEEVKTLLNYKDKEYPEKALQIARLKRQKEILEATFKEELDELEAVIEAERTTFSDERTAIQRDITERVTEKTIGAMKDSVKDMALQNMIMKKEVEIHKNELKLLQENNAKVEAEIRELIDSSELNAQAQMFPNLFAEREKCTPDMDLKLDIPTQEWLPI